MASDKPTHHDDKDEKGRHEAALAQAHAAEKAAAEDKRAAAPLTPAGINLLIALLAADWVIGDKHHYAAIRKQTLKLLGDLGADGAEAKARLEGMSGAVALVPQPVAKAA